MRVFLHGYRLWVRARAKLFGLACRPAFYYFGSSTSIELPVRLTGEKYISIGNGVFIGANSWLLAMAHDSNRAVISIGDGCSFAGFCTITAAQSVCIEARVLMARNVYISDHSHAHDSRNQPILAQGITRISPVRICTGAWIGQNVVVCPGVTIGRNAVIGANSVVRHDVPDYCVAAGVPARVLRKVDDHRK